MFKPSVHVLMGIQNWRTLVTSKDLRSRERKEEDRKRRQLEKLPDPTLMWAPTYMKNKELLCDHWFQPPVYSDHLDTPHNFISPERASRDFFFVLDHRAFEENNCPSIPHTDYRQLSNEDWLVSKERKVALQYLRKHKIYPCYFKRIKNDVNFTAVHGALGPNSENFWMSPHFGNFVELGNLQERPAICIPSDGNVYSLYIVSPDYPFRTHADSGFLLHALYINLQGKESTHVDISDESTIVPYIPPLPTEDAGMYRFMYILLKQEQRIIPHEKKTPWALSERRNFFLHSSSLLSAIEESVHSHPSSIRFLHTVWDFHVQAFYERSGEAEPRYIPDDSYAELLNYADTPAPSSNLSRMNTDGGINETCFFGHEYIPPAHHFTVPYLSANTRKPEQGMYWKNPLHSP